MQVWRPPPHTLVLAPGDVHVWRIEQSLRFSPDVLEERRALLDESEVARMERYRFERHQVRFALRRGALRIILARYLRTDPRGVTFRISAHGKPELLQHGEPSLRFNVSHSEDVALVAVGETHDLGVDVEQLRAIPEMDQLAQTVFSPAELEQYRALPEHEATQGFFNGWTRKEAWLKARGEGLIGELAAFDVTLTPREPPRLLRVADSPEEAKRWHLRSFSPLRGFAAAVAMRGRIRRMERWSL